MKKKHCINGQHPICSASDSKLAECVCWCAECKEYQREAARVYMEGVK
jgi:hypothetical protein